MKHKKYEARDLNWNLHFYKKYGNPDDRIWITIIDDVKKYEELRKHRPFCGERISDESPFIQGDQVAQGLPDVIYECDDFVMGIEVFQFDASGKIKKGSRMIRAELDVNRHHNKLARESTIRPLQLEDKVDTSFSYERYVQSLNNTFVEHANNIETYIKSLQKEFPNKKIYLSFFIEDITAIGNYMIINGQQTEMNPLYVGEFIDLLSSYRGIDYILTKTQDVYIKSLTIQRIDEHSIKELKEQCYDMSKDIFLEYSYKRISNIHSASELDTSDDEDT